jgi:hypothetical protein
MYVVRQPYEPADIRANYCTRNLLPKRDSYPIAYEVLNMDCEILSTYHTPTVDRAGWQVTPLTHSRRPCGRV